MYQRNDAIQNIYCYLVGGAAIGRRSGGGHSNRS